MQVGGCLQTGLGRGRCINLSYGGSNSSPAPRKKGRGIGLIEVAAPLRETIIKNNHAKVSRQQQPTVRAGLGRGKPRPQNKKGHQVFHQSLGEAGDSNKYKANKRPRQARGV